MATQEQHLRLVRMALSDIKDHPANPNVHPTRQARALRDIIGRVGVADVIIVNERTGHCLDGHLRLAEARRNGETEVDVGLVDVDELHERAALGTIDPIGRLVRANPQMQGALLRKIPEGMVPAAVRPASIDTARAALEKATKAAAKPKEPGERPTKTEVVRRPHRMRVIGFDNETDRLEFAKWMAMLSPDLGSTQTARVIGYIAKAKEASLW